MTQKQHPIIPPDELFKQWEDDILNQRDNVDHVLDCAWRNGFQAGADQELGACCEWLELHYPHVYTTRLKRCRRPKPPSLADQALEQLRGIETCFLAMHGGGLIDDVIHAALKRLKELEEEKQ